MLQIRTLHTAKKTEGPCATAKTATAKRIKFKNKIVNLKKKKRRKSLQTRDRQVLHNRDRRQLPLTVITTVELNIFNLNDKLLLF